MKLTFVVITTLNVLVHFTAALTPHEDSANNENKITQVKRLKIPDKVTTTAATTTTTTPVPATTTTTEAPEKRILSSKQLLRNKLLEGYDKLVHPAERHDSPIKVGVGLAIIHFDIDEMKSIFSVDVWMRMSWNDSFLKWEPTDHDNITQIHFGANEIWRPDVLLYNSADEAKLDPYGNTHFVVQSSGEVLWVPPAHLKAYCKLNLRFWPLDHQTCKLKFGSWTSSGNSIDVNLYKEVKKPEFLNFYTNNHEWKVKGSTAKKNTMTYLCCPEPYPDVTFEFQLSRTSPAYKATMVLPCLVIMLMTVCCFLLPPNAGEKIFINGFAFIASVMYLIYFASTIPFHESDVPILVMFFSNTTALIGISLLLNVTCISMCRERKFSGPPKFLRELFSGSFGKLLCLGHYYHQVSSTHQRLVLELDDMAESDQPATSQNANSFTVPDSEVEAISGGFATSTHGRALSGPGDGSMVMKEWTLVAAGLERFFFILYTIAFAVVTSVYV